MCRAGRPSSRCEGGAGGGQAWSDGGGGGGGGSRPRCSSFGAGGQDRIGAGRRSGGTTSGSEDTLQAYRLRLMKFVAGTGGADTETAL